MHKSGFCNEPLPSCECWNMLVRITQSFFSRHTSLYYTVLGCTRQYHYVLHSITLYYKLYVLRSTTLYYTILLCTSQYYLVLHSITFVLHSTTVYYTLLRTTQYDFHNTRLFCTTPYYSVLNSTITHSQYFFVLPLTTAWDLHFLKEHGGSKPVAPREVLSYKLLLSGLLRNLYCLEPYSLEVQQQA